MKLRTGLERKSCQDKSLWYKLKERGIERERREKEGGQRIERRKQERQVLKNTRDGGSILFE